MSSVVSGVTKVFKTVVKVVKKVAAPALAIGAVVFTAGAALGVAGMAGGWGGAISGLVSKMGATGILGNVLTGALTQAGYGAAIGGLAGAVTGKGALKGAGVGALTGGLTGGVMGAAGMSTDPLAGFFKDTSAPANVGPASQWIDPDIAARGNGLLPSARAGNLGPVPVQTENLPLAGSQWASEPPIYAPEGTPQEYLFTGLNEPAPALSAPTVADLSSSAARIGRSAGGAAPTGMLSYLNQNPAVAMMAGPAIAGLGTGLVNMASAKDSAEATREAALLRLQGERERDARVAANYAGAGPGLLREQDLAYMGGQAPRPTPAQRFDPASYGGRYVYDPASRLIVFVRNA